MTGDAVHNAAAIRGEAAARAERKRCNFCKELIVWARTAAAHDAPRMPCDADPSRAGNVLLIADVTWGLVATVIGTTASRAAHTAAGWPLRTHHRLSCPYAAEWNRPAARAAAPRARR